MSLNEVLHAIVAKLPHHSEGHEQQMHAAVDAAVPPSGPAPADAGPDTDDKGK